MSPPAQALKVSAAGIALCCVFMGRVSWGRRDTPDGVAGVGFPSVSGISPRSPEFATPPWTRVYVLPVAYACRGLSPTKTRFTLLPLGREPQAAGNGVGTDTAGGLNARHELIRPASDYLWLPWDWTTISCLGRSTRAKVGIFPPQL